MMRSMRAKGNRSLALILVGLLIVGLAGFGVGGLGGGRINTVASVGDAPVTVSAYVRMLNQRLQQMGRALSTSEAEEIGIFRDVLRISLDIAAVSNEAMQSGISVGDEFVLDSLMEGSRFQGIDGNFDQAVYEFAIERAGLTTAEFEEELRDELRRGIIRDAVALGVHSSGALSETILRYELERRDFEWARFTESNLDSPVEFPSGSQIEAHYSAHPDDYMSPLTRSLTYSWLRPDMLIDEVKVTDAELQEEYDAQPERFDIPEMRAVERIAFETEQVAADARARLDSGAVSFDEIFVERGIEPGDAYLGMVARDDLSADAAEAVFALDQPGIAGPVESVFGLALFRVGSIQNAITTSIDDVRDELRAELALGRAISLVSERVSEIDDLLASGATIEEITAETELEGGKLDLSELVESHRGIAAHQEFRDAAWSIESGGFPEILDLADGSIFMVRLDSVREPAPLPLSAVRDDVVDDWKSQVVMDRLFEVAGRVKSSLTGGGTLEEHGLDAQTETGVVRNATVVGAPRHLIAEVFSLGIGEVTTVEGDDGMYLARLSEIRVPESEVEEAVTRSRERNDRVRGSDMFQLYTTAVESSAGVSINQTAINQINTQLVVGGDG